MAVPMCMRHNAVRHPNREGAAPGMSSDPQRMVSHDQDASAWI